MPHYFLKLNPRRPTFAQDITDQERAIMQQHIAYWGDLMNKGVVVVYGPVIDPKGVYGMGVIEAESEQHVQELTQNDPAATINDYEYYPMRAIMPARS
jgi:uncharacterized protein YciI